MNEIKLLDPQAKITTLPEITTNMAEVLKRAEAIQERYAALVITEEMMEDIKKEKAQLNKDKNTIAEFRKNITEQYNKPLEQFIKDAKASETALKRAYDTCNESVNHFQEKKRLEKVKEVTAYFDEKNNVEWLKFERANINVLLSSSKKSLCDQVDNFLQRIENDISMISTLEHQAEIITEYKKNLNASMSVAVVNERIRQEQEEKQRLEAKKKALEQQKELGEQKEVIPENIEQKAQNQEIKAPEEVYTMKFSVKGTLSQLKSLKAFMEREGMMYE